MRRAVISDIPSLKELYRLLLLHEQGFGEFHFCTEGMISAREELYKHIITSGEGFILLEEDGGRVIGMLCAQYSAGETGNPVQKPVFIQDAYFLPEYQKKGGATKLFDEALKICKKDKKQAIYLWVSPNNEFLQKKLERDYGFKTVYNLKAKKL